MVTLNPKKSTNAKGDLLTSIQENRKKKYVWGKYLRHFEQDRPIFQCRTNLATMGKGKEKVTFLEITIAF